GRRPTRRDEPVPIPQSFPTSSRQARGAAPIVLRASLYLQAYLPARSMMARASHSPSKHSQCAKYCIGIVLTMQNGKPGQYTVAATHAGICAVAVRHCEKRRAMQGPAFKAGKWLIVEWAS